MSKDLCVKLTIDFHNGDDLALEALCDYLKENFNLSEEYLEMYKNAHIRTRFWKETEGSDGLIYIKSLYQNSECNLEDGGMKSEKPMTIEEYLEDKESIFDYEIVKMVDKKVRELLNV